MDNSEKSDTIWDQLKDDTIFTKPVDTPKSIEEEPLTAENAESFIYKNAQSLITTAIQSMDSLKEIVQTNPTAEEAEALAKLIEATSSAIETVNKLVTIDKKNATAIKIKQMDVESRRENLQTSINATLTLTREQALKRALESKPQEKLIQGTIIESTPISDSES